MAVERIEYRRYDRTSLETVLKFQAKLALVGTIYYGRIGAQEVRWLDDGTAEVFTHHTPMEPPHAK